MKNTYQHLNPLSVYFSKHLAQKHIDHKLNIIDCLPYLEFVTFISLYSEKSKLTPIQLTITEPSEGYCISVSKLWTEVFQEGLRELPDNFFNTVESVSFKGQPSYTEGVTLLEPCILHAWLTIENNRHTYAIDPTRKFKQDELDLETYYGVPFELEFLEDIRSRQIKNNFVDTLPYLRCNNNGISCSVLTYKPLIQGKLAEYPIYKSDIEETYFDLLSQQETL